MHTENTVIKVNGHKIKIAGQQATGKHIKQSAEEQGANIEVSFDLFLKTDDGQQEISNNETVNLTDGQHFIAKSQSLVIFVNEHKVTIAQHKVIGLHIKEAAVEQGVPNVHLHDALTMHTAEGPKIIEDQEKVNLHPKDKFNTHAREIEILVNEKPVIVKKSTITGLEIKQAAISQGVAIQLDFVLSMELGDRRSKIIGDTDVVHVHKHSRFIAVAPDDNS